MNIERVLVELERVMDHINSALNLWYQIHSLWAIDENVEDAHFFFRRTTCSGRLSSLSLERCRNRGVKSDIVCIGVEDQRGKPQVAVVKQM